MKFALVLSGQPRQYDPNKWKFIIESLGADVFIHTWYGKDRESDVIDINKLISDFNPKEISVSNPHKFKDILPEDSYYATTSYHTVNLSYSMSNAVMNMIQYSRIFNIKYDAVIRSRFDLDFIDINSAILAMKTLDTADYLYVASNHWQGHVQFDDNIMFGSFENISYFTKYYSAVIDSIYKTKQIQSGEYSMFQFCNRMGLSKYIKRIQNLDFNLIRVPGPKFILNQNEE